VQQHQQRGKQDEKIAVVAAKQFTLNASGKASNLCGELNKYEEHLALLQKKSYGLVCAWCGGTMYTQCGKCDAALHHKPNRGVFHGVNCFNNYHNSV
jgi:hypothetical protein